MNKNMVQHSKNGGGPPHSKMLAHRPGVLVPREASWSAAALRRFSSRIILTLSLFILSKSLCLGQSTVQFYLTQFTGSTNDTTITVKSRNNPVIYNGQFYWQPPNGTNVNTTNGFASVNLIPGPYTVSFAGIP